VNKEELTTWLRYEFDRLGIGYDADVVADYIMIRDTGGTEELLAQYVAEAIIAHDGIKDELDKL